MTLDNSVDIPLQAIAALLRAAIPLETNTDALQAVYEDPRDLQTLAARSLPALAIYRGTEQRIQRNSVQSVRRITVQFDYVLPATGIERRADRWPALSTVWNKIVDLVLAGKHQHVSAGANVLDAADVNVDRSSPKVEYGFADRGGESYPIARGSILIDHDPAAVDVATIDHFLTFHASYEYALITPTASTPGQPGTSTGESPDVVTLPEYGT